MQQEEAEWLAILEQGKGLSEGRLSLSSEASPAEEGSRAESAPILKHLQQQSHTALSFQVT